VLDRDGQEVKTNYTILDENRISIEADTSYSGLEVNIEGQIETGEKPLIFLAENSVRFLTGFKNITASYSVTGGMRMDGFMPKPGFAGYNSKEGGAPGVPFLFGAQDKNFARDAASNGWLTTNSSFKDPFTISKTENFNIKGTFEPFKGFRIELNGTRSYTEFNSEYFHHDSLASAGDNTSFYFDNHTVNGGYSISVISIGSAFEKLDADNFWSSPTYERFKSYRQTISRRLHNQMEDKSGSGYQGSAQQEVIPGYDDGYGPTSPQVLIPAFLAAYTNKDPKTISLKNFPGFLSILPNWTLTFDGLPKIDLFGRYLKSATFRHAYKSIYSINSYSTNYLYAEDEMDGISYMRDAENNFVPELQMNSVSIREEFNPLFGFDGTWTNNLLTRFEYRKARILALSMANNQLTENQDNELIIGAGYRFNAVALKIGEKAYKSDLNLRFDLSVRDNKTIVRYLAETNKDESDQITMGDRIFKMEFTADYLLSPRFNLRFFFDRTLNNPHTTRSYRRVDTNIGFSLRFTLTQ
jgi:cell surface protein SprA